MHGVGVRFERELTGGEGLSKYSRCTVDILENRVQKEIRQKK